MEWVAENWFPLLIAVGIAVERGFRLWGPGQRAAREATKLKEASVALVNILNAEVNYLTKHSGHSQAIEKMSQEKQRRRPRRVLKNNLTGFAAW